MSAMGSVSKQYSRKRSYEGVDDGLTEGLAMWMRKRSHTSEEDIDLRSTLQLAMELERDVRRCINQQAVSYERNRLESLRVAMANPIPDVVVGPRTQEASVVSLSRSPVSALRRAGKSSEKHAAERPESQIISSLKDSSSSEVAMMAVLNLRDKST
mmetsp:Transcript_13674/g.27008  ORF Transcript_13674/g.27008 Transcript_13674/m.27008 type:complete len:156 (+) Transcript_13674:330-797(+)